MCIKEKVNTDLKYLTADFAYLSKEVYCQTRIYIDSKAISFICNFIKIAHRKKNRKK